MIIFKLLNYLFSFKVSKNYPIAEILFVILFITFLFLPLSGVDTSKNIVQENRLLAKFPELVSNNKLNKNFGNEFNNWFNDRFLGRQMLIQFNSKMECQLNRVYCGNELATFYKNKNLVYLNRSWGLSPITDNKISILKLYAKNINELQKFCDKNNIKLYIFIAPRQVDFFDNTGSFDERINLPDPADEVISYLKSNTKTNIVYPKETMLNENTKEHMYFKTDNHWTKAGAYIGYLELLKSIRNDFNNIFPLDKNKLIIFYDKRVSTSYPNSFSSGAGVDQIGLPKTTAEKMLDTRYLYYENPDYKNLKISNYTSSTNFQKEDGDIEITYNKGINKKILVIGNSFSHGLIEFLPYNFQTTIRLVDHIGKRNLNFEVYKNLLLDEKPDILVLCFQTTYMLGV